MFNKNLFIKNLIEKLFKKILQLDFTSEENIMLIKKHLCKTFFVSKKRQKKVSDIIIFPLQLYSYYIFGS